MEKSKISDLEEKFDACMKQHDEELNRDYQACGFLSYGAGDGEKKAQSCKDNARYLFERRWRSSACADIEKAASEDLSKKLSVCGEASDAIYKNMDHLCNTLGDTEKRDECNNTTKRLKHQLSNIHGCPALQRVFDELNNR